MFNQTACQYFAMDIHCKFCICLLDKYFCKMFIFLDKIFVVVPDMFFLQIVVVLDNMGPIGKLA